MSYYEILLRKIDYYITKDEWNIMIEETKQSMNEFYRHLMEEELCGYCMYEAGCVDYSPNHYTYQFDTLFKHHKIYNDIVINVCLLYQEPNKFVSVAIDYKKRETYRNTCCYDRYNDIKSIPKICLSNPRAAEIMRALKNAYDIV